MAMKIDDFQPLFCWLMVSKSAASASNEGEMWGLGAGLARRVRNICECNEQSGP